MDTTLSTSDPISSTFTFANFCEGNNNEPIDLSLPNGVFSFVTPPTGGATIDPSTGVISNGVGGTTYTVQYVNSGATCSDTAFANVTVYTMPIVDFEGDTTQGMPPLLINFTNNSFGADNYTWGFGDGSNEQNNDVQVPHTFYDEGTFTTLLTGKSGNGLCVDTASIKIIVFYPEIVYKFPNVFTPNGDNSNDNFKFVYHKHIKSLHIVILNRWGNPLFESNKMDFHWNGKINNSGEECVDGTYFYKADLKSYKAEEIQEHGFIQLSRGK
jgi:gliding motility-associated-like protein